MNQDAIEVCELLSEQKDLLRLVHHTATEPPGKQNAKADIANFLFCHALHIYELAKAALLLMQSREPYAVILLGRSALESMFNMVATMEDKQFGPQRLAWEIEELAKKLQLMTEKGAWLASCRPTPEECRKEAARIRQYYQAPLPSQQSEKNRIAMIEQIAKVAGLSPFYDDEYRQLSLTVHSNQAGILNAGSGFLVKKGMLAVCNATFLASQVLTRAFAIKAFDVQLKDHHARLETLMQKPDLLPLAKN